MKVRESVIPGQRLLELNRQAVARVMMPGSSDDGRLDAMPSPCSCRGERHRRQDYGPVDDAMRGSREAAPGDGSDGACSRCRSAPTRHLLRRCARHAAAPPSRARSRAVPEIAGSGAAGAGKPPAREPSGAALGLWRRQGVREDTRSETVSLP